MVLRKLLAAVSTLLVIMSCGAEEVSVSTQSETTETTATTSSPIFIENGVQTLQQQALRTRQNDGSKTTTASDESSNQEEEDDVPFCMPGMSMVMFMNGFRRSLGTKQEPDPNCLNYYFRTWTLTEVGKFHGALVFSVLLALLTEGLSAVRDAVMKHIPKGRVRRFLMVTIFTVQQFMGYIIMLTAMMYSIELFFAVLLGLAIGNRLFDRRRTPPPPPPDAARDPMRQPLLRR